MIQCPLIRNSIDTGEAMSEDVNRPAYLIQGYTVSDGLIIKTASQTHIKDSTIEALNMSGRAFNAVMRMFFSMDKSRENVMVSELLLTPEEDFRHFKGIGQTGFQEIIDKVKIYLDDENNIEMRKTTAKSDAAESPDFSGPEARGTIATKEDIADVFKNREFAILSFNEIRESLPVSISEIDLIQLLEELITKEILKSKGNGYSLQYPSFFDFTEYHGTEKNIDKHERGIRILTARAEGKTLEDIGVELGVTRERVRQLEIKAFKGFSNNGDRVFDEDKYRYLYANYDFSNDFYLNYLKMSDQTLYYLRYRYTKGSAEAICAIEDNKIAADIRQIIYQYVHKDSIFIDGVHIPLNRASIENAVIRKYCREEVSAEEFFDIYANFVNGNGLSKDQFGIDDSNKRTRLNRIAGSMHALWKQNQRLRYYDIPANDYTELLETLNLGQYNNIELSTRKFFLEYTKLMQTYDIHDEYELHNLLKKINAGAENPTLQFKRMPTLQFGKFKRDEEVKKILFSMAPVSIDDLAEVISETYGARVDTIKANWLSGIGDYYHQGVYSVDYEDMPDFHMELLKDALTEDFYYVSEVQEIYSQRIPNADRSLVSPYNLKKMGFLVGLSYAIQNHSSADAYFMSILTDQDVFDISPMQKRYSSLQSYTGVLYQLKKERSIIEYEPYKYVSIRRLEQLGVSLTQMQEYVEQLREFLPDDSFFTIKSVKNSGFKADLDSLSFPDYFYSSLIKEDEKFTSRTFGGVTIFNPKNERFNIKDFLLAKIKELGAVRVEDLRKILEEKYGISTDRFNIVQRVEDSDAFYDPNVDKIYVDFTTFLESD